MPLTLCTFNVNNLYARYKFGKVFPGDRSNKSLIGDPGFGYLPLYNKKLFDLFNPVQRALEADVITQGGPTCPDIICLQEIESLLALRKFNEEFLAGTYPYALLIDSRDFRQIDVGVLSKFPLIHVRSHMDEPDPESDDSNNPYLFSRDCLEIDVPLPGSNEKLTLFINHLKSKYAESDEETREGDELRFRQATAVNDIVHKRFPGSKFDNALFAVLGDFNDVPQSPSLQPLLSESGLFDVMKRIDWPEDRWSHWYKSENTVSQLDYILLSPRLNDRTDGNIPTIERRGIGMRDFLKNGKPGPKKTKFFESEDGTKTEISFQFDRFEEVNKNDFASDHCAVFFDIP